MHMSLTISSDSLIGWIRFRAGGQAFKVHAINGGTYYYNPILGVFVPLAPANASRIVSAF